MRRSANVQVALERAHAIERAGIGAKIDMVCARLVCAQEHEVEVRHCCGRSIVWNPAGHG